jgi:hypothetical protein
MHTLSRGNRRGGDRQEAGGYEGRGGTSIHPAVRAEVRRQQLRMRNEVLNAVEHRV